MKRKKLLWLCAACVMAFSISACGSDEDVQSETVNVEQIGEIEEEAVKEEAVEEEAVEEEDVEEEAIEEDFEYEGDAASSYNEQYGEVLDQYYTALTEKWDEGKLLS
ncbi:MAG: hypothetical protein PUG54_10100, partial [Firmicutes bacterium]|nr:hypothetical protein [Bacillota bacterium]